MPPVTWAGALVGRDSERALLHRLTKEVVAGHGSSLLIEGEPGIGKSALVQAAADDAVMAGCQVFWGTCEELDQELPLLPLLDGLRVREPSANPRRKAIVRLLDGEAPAGVNVPAVLAEQLMALITEQCSVRPTIVVVDDLQWADKASIGLWGRLARSARRVPLLVIGMMRPVPQRDELLTLRRTAEDTAHLQLTGLADEAVTELLTTLAGGRPGDRLWQLAAGAAGNPLYVTELVAALSRGSGLTVTEAGTAELAGGSAPGSLPAAIANRIGFVTGPVRDMLRAAALLGMDFAVSDLAVVLGRDVAGLIPAVEEARAAGVLAESGRGLGFRHPLIRATLYDDLPESVRAAWHQEAARKLAAAGAPVDRVARQLLRAAGPADGAAGPVDQWLLDWLAGAADLLVGQAPGVAADLLSRAAGSSPAGSAQHNWLASRLADARYRLGDTTAAEQVVIRTLPHATEPDLLVDLHRTLAHCRGQQGSAAESLATLDQALASPRLSAGHRAHLLVMAAATHVTLGELDKAAGVADRARAAAQEADDSWAMVWALHVLTVVTVAKGNMTDALPLFDQALAVIQSDPSLTDMRLLLQVNQAVTLGSLDRYEEALAAAVQARDLADQIGTGIRLVQAHCVLGQLLYETGRWDDALTEIGSVHEDLKDPRAACCELGFAAAIRFHRGDAAAAREQLAAAVPYASLMGGRPVAQLALAHSLDREQDGALPEALAALTGAFDSDPGEIEETEKLLADAVRLAARTGDLEVARDLAGHVTALAAESQIPHRQADALYCQGLLDRDAPRLLAAAGRYGEAARPLQRAKALEAAADHFVAGGDREQARAAFTGAVEVYSSLDAAADVARLQATFRAHGIRRGPRAKHRRAQSGWESLTETEIKVASFVEEGLSNPEIAGRLLLSRRTVATHVSHILKKLDVHSRTDIARESARRTITSR